jgi:hypothetical protein
MDADPLKSALNEIAPTLDPEMQALLTTLIAEESVEDAWQALVQEVLSEA